jgi:hypothetical protein
MIVCARTAPQRPDDRRYGISLLVVDTKSPGYTVGRKLDKIGLGVSSTAELSFIDVRVRPRTCSARKTRVSPASARICPSRTAASRAADQPDRR